MVKTIIYLIRHSEQLKIRGDVFSKDSDQVSNEKIVLSCERRTIGWDIKRKR